MTLQRPTSDHQRAAIKGLARRQVQACHGQESAASITRVGGQTLSDYGNARTEKYRDIHMPLDVLMDLTLDGGPVALIGLCRMAGGAFVPLPQPGEGSAWAVEVGEAVRKGGDAAARICAALADDGKVDAAEIAEHAILDHLAEAIDALVRLKSHAAQVLEDDA
ncbi:hypothetical protein [Stappia sp. ES.058]|uniref:hypothetical protein n=1 Tax=Stappia sp. ES.058 TaxID=1881061 RepID=UPI00087CB751|nr:hypothetical protein [Stappia sp. ES.058]SDT96700.1 hypothetical protein SAMN05428979_0784 [Stappia sp. ES.058]